MAQQSFFASVSCSHFSFQRSNGRRGGQSPKTPPRTPSNRTSISSRRSITANLLESPSLTTAAVIGPILESITDQALKSDHSRKHVSARTLAPVQTRSKCRFTRVNSRKRAPRVRATSATGHQSTTAPSNHRHRGHIVRFVQINHECFDMPQGQLIPIRFRITPPLEQACRSGHRRIEPHGPDIDDARYPSPSKMTCAGLDITEDGKDGNAY